ncbi:MAG: TraG family conjugative transposon ATPase, partial [Bacteroidales bacterium]|nr:TraG family conjugative transposon ATPase [Bacteroidales bacterium]
MEEIGMREVYPHFPIVDGVIESRRGDICFGWEVQLPPAFRCNPDAYDAMVKSIASAIALLPDYSIVHKQDIFMYKTYEQGLTSQEYLQGAYERHFAGRRYLDHTCRLYLTFANKGNIGKGSGIVGLSIANVPSAADLTKAFAAAEQFESMMGAGTLLSLRRLADDDFNGHGDFEAGILQNYINFSESGADVLSDFVPRKDCCRTGDKIVVCHTVSELDQMPGELSPYKRIQALSTEQSSVNLSTFSGISIDLDCEHIVNQIIYKLPQRETLAKLDLKRRRMTSMSRSTENRIYADELNEFAEEAAKVQKTIVGYHLNVLTGAPADRIEAAKDKATSALSKCGVVPVYNIRNAAEIFWASMPGNEAGLSLNEYMTIDLEGALCTWIYDGYDEGIPDGNMKLSERQKQVPIRFDIQEVAKEKNLIENFNVFLLGPSGSGKSFFMNKYLKSCYDNDQHVFLIDVGHSYRGLCNIIKEESGGTDGSYYTCEKGSPLSFNPFRDVRRFQTMVKDESGDTVSNPDYDEVSINFLYSLMLTLWKNGKEEVSPTALRFVKESVDMFVSVWDKETDPIFDDYFKFLKGPFSSYLKKEAVDASYFDIKGYLLALQQFTGKYKYGKLLNSNAQIDALHDRFVVFEIDNIKDDETIYPITTLVIMDMFTEKMRKTPEFKVLVNEEAWKSLMGSQMAGF